MPETIIVDEEQEKVEEKPSPCEISRNRMRNNHILDPISQGEPEAEEEQPEEVSEISDTELVPYIEGHSQLIRGERRILDFDLKNIYGVSTRALNRAYKRNQDMFEDNWVIQLDSETWQRLCQNGTTLDEKQRFRPESPLVYNAEGANCVAFQLKESPIARKRAKTIIKVFTDLERMAHGEEPKQPGFAEAISSLVEFTVINRKLVVLASK